MSEPDPPPNLTYPGAPDSVIARWMVRREPVRYRKTESLPPLDADLVSLAAVVIPMGEPRPDRSVPPYTRKLGKLRAELGGQTELALLNAILIVNLRREAYPPQAPGLFVRIWREHGEAMKLQLPGRWLISSIITFGEVGETESQRRIGLALNVLFSAMKLYESERTFSGVPPHELFSGQRRRGKGPLPLGMSSFGFFRGGLDFNLLAPIWKDAMADPVAGPLACHLLERLNADPGNIFRRIRRMTSANQHDAAADPAPPSQDDIDS